MLTLAKVSISKSPRCGFIMRICTTLKPAQEFEEQQQQGNACCNYSCNCKLPMHDGEDDGKAFPTTTFLRILWSLQHDFSNRPRYLRGGFLEPSPSLVQGLEKSRWESSNNDCYFYNYCYYCYFVIQTAYEIILDEQSIYRYSVIRSHFAFT
jgi:hypothetical protein